MTTTLQRLVRTALEKTNKRKHGPLFGEVRFSQAEPLVEAFLAELLADVREGKRVWLPGVGTFSLRHRVARDVQHPQTRERLAVPAQWAVGFSPAKVNRGLTR